MSAYGATGTCHQFAIKTRFVGSVFWCRNVRKATPRYPFRYAGFHKYTQWVLIRFGKFSTLLDFSMAYKANDLTRCDLICRF